MHLYEYPDIDGIIYNYYYPIFQLAVDYLVDAKGHAKSLRDVRDLFLDISVGVAFATAFENRLEISIKEYEVRFFDLMIDYLQW